MGASSLLSLLCFLLVLHRVATLRAEDIARSSGKIAANSGNDPVRYPVRYPPTPPPSMISELEVKSDHDLRKSLVRTTMAVRAYSPQHTTAAPKQPPPSPPIQRVSTPVLPLRGEVIITRPSTPSPYTPLIQPPPALSSQQSVVPTIAGGLNLYALVDPTSIRSAGVDNSVAGGGFGGGGGQYRPTQPARPRNATSAQYEQLGCSWDLISQTCKDVFQIGWCQQCTDFGSSVFIHDCKCMTVTALYANAASALASAASSAFIASQTSPQTSRVNYSASVIPPAGNLPPPIFHPPQLAALQQPTAIPPTMRTPHRPAEHQVIVVPVPVPVPVIAHPSNVNAITTLQHFPQTQSPNLLGIANPTTAQQPLTPPHDHPPNAVADNSAPHFFKPSNPSLHASQAHSSHASVQAQTHSSSSYHQKAIVSTPVHVPTMWFD